MPTRLFSTFFPIFLLLAVVFSPESALAQTGQVVTGYVVDAADNQVIPYATVVLKQAQKGSATDFSGYFEIWVDSLPPNDTLLVSSIGFLQGSLAITASPKQVWTIKLKKSTQQLREVTVEAKTETALEIVEQAVQNRPNLLPGNPLILEALYREIVKNKGRYVGMTEADGMLFLGGYQRNHLRDHLPQLTHDVAQWKHLRRTDYAVTDDNHPTQARRLSVNRLLLLKEHYTYNGPVSKAGLKEFRYQLDSVAFDGNVPVYSIFFAPQDSKLDFPSGVLQIRGDDYGLASLTVENDFKALKPAGKLSQNRAFVTALVSIHYSKFQGQYHLNHMRLTSAYSLSYPEEPEQDKTIEEFLEIVGGKFSTQQAPELNTNQRTVLYHEMVNPIIRYDHNYWVKRRLSYEMAFGTVVSQLAQEESLDIQYLFHNGKRIFPLPKGYRSYEELIKDQDSFYNWMNLGQ